MRGRGLHVYSELTNLLVALEQLLSRGCQLLHQLINAHIVVLQTQKQNVSNPPYYRLEVLFLIPIHRLTLTGTLLVYVRVILIPAYTVQKLPHECCVRPLCACWWARSADLPYSCWDAPLLAALLPTAATWSRICEWARGNRPSPTGERNAINGFHMNRFRMVDERWLPQVIFWSRVVAKSLDLVGKGEVGAMKLKN